MNIQNKVNHYRLVFDAINTYIEARNSFEPDASLHEQMVALDGSAESVEYYTLQIFELEAEELSEAECAAIARLLHADPEPQALRTVRVVIDLQLTPEEDDDATADLVMQVINTHMTNDAELIEVTAFSDSLSKTPS